jgi:arylsulfatase A-like enzyme
MAGVGLLPSPGPAAPAAQRPNILFIMVDEMRWDVMSCAGHPIVKTPNLDRLAREGTRFATTYTASPVCVPARYCAFTGRYAHVHGSLNNQTPPQAGELLLPAILQHYGYETAISGKLHFLPLNQRRSYGFDYFWSDGNEGPGKLESWPQFLAKKHGPKAQQLLDQPYPNDPLGKDIARLPYPKEDTQTFWVTDRAVDYLDQRDTARPFFLFVSYLAPHSPSHLPEPYWSLFDPNQMPAPKIPEAVKQERAQALQAGQFVRHLVGDEAMARKLMATYFAKVTMIDDNVGRLLQEVGKRGLRDNTLVVFTSDHGNMLADRGRWFKGAMYEGSSHIPLLIQAPQTSSLAGTFNRGKVITQVVENIDILPTLMEMIGLPLAAERGVQGRSLVNLVGGRDPHWKDVAYSELDPKMIRTPRYKLIQNGEFKRFGGPGDYELYDLLKDPQEANDLSADPLHAQVLRELKAKLATWLADRPAAPVMAGVERTLPAKPLPPPLDVRQAERRRPPQQVVPAK